VHVTVTASTESGPGKHGWAGGPRAGR